VGTLIKWLRYANKPREKPQSALSKAVPRGRVAQGILSTQLSSSVIADMKTLTLAAVVAISLFTVIFGKTITGGGS
jgi:hypothetical protein